MLTIFAIPKPFRGHTGTIQQNAILSWLELCPSCEIILCGNEEGTAQVAAEYGVRHISKIARSEYGTPLGNDLFEKAHQAATHQILCYVNCDIILMNDFVEALGTIRQWSRRFLMVGECWNLDVESALVCTEADWGAKLHAMVRERGTRRGPASVDYFAFTRGLYKQMPPFAVGRAYFDNWLIWKARASKAAVVDATPLVTAVHQNHGYSHVRGGRTEAYLGQEAKINLQIGGGQWRRLFIYDSSYVLTRAGLKLNLGGYLRLNWFWKRKHQHMRRLVWWLMELTRPVRHPLGLRIDTLRRWKSYLAR